MAYKKIEYIESTIVGGQYIDTGVKPNQDTTVICDYHVLGFKDSYLPYVFSAIDNEYKFEFHLGASSFVEYRCGLYGSTVYNDYYSNRHVVKLSKGLLYIDDTLIASNGYHTFQLSTTLRLLNSGKSISACNARMYSCKIYELDTLVRDYEPVLNSDGVAGLYDKVNDVFYSSVTSSHFIAGPEIEETTALDFESFPFGFRRRLLLNVDQQGGGLPPGTTFDFPYTGTVQEVTLPKGRYKLQCWGAQGTDSPNASGPGGVYKGIGSNGGYSEGVLSINKDTILYVFVGGHCDVSSKRDEVVNGGWNGGGGCVPSFINNDYGVASATGQGGGATDIALVPSDMTYSGYRTNRSQESLLSRIIVAGGGGGGSAYSYWDPSDPFSVNGGQASNNKAQGGGIEGGSSRSLYKGTQSKAGDGGGFGFGGTNIGVGDGAGAGGGGWYGGGTGVSTDRNGGGSGFVNIAANAQYRPEGYTGLELESGQTIAGNTQFPSVDGYSETGHSGNGYARITVV